MNPYSFLPFLRNYTESLIRSERELFKFSSKKVRFFKNR